MAHDTDDIASVQTAADLYDRMVAMAPELEDLFQLRDRVYQHLLFLKGMRMGVLVAEATSLAEQNDHEGALVRLENALAILDELPHEDWPAAGESG